MSNFSYKQELEALHKKLYELEALKVRCDLLEEIQRLRDHICDLENEFSCRPRWNPYVQIPWCPTYWTVETTGSGCGDTYTVTNGTFTKSTDTKRF